MVAVRLSASFCVRLRPRRIFSFTNLSINSTAEATPPRHPTRSTPVASPLHRPPTVSRRLNVDCCLVPPIGGHRRKWSTPISNFLSFNSTAAPTSERQPPYVPPILISSPTQPPPPTPFNLIVVLNRQEAAIQGRCIPPLSIFLSFNSTAAPASERHLPSVSPVRISSPTHPSTPTPSFI